MSRQSSATLNYQLTNYAQGHLNDLMAGESMALARRLAPPVPVGGSSGQYKAFSDLNAFQVYNTARAMGGDPTRMVFATTDPTYSCLPQALEITVDKAERQAAGDDPMANQLLDQAKIKILLGGAARSHAKAVVDKVLSSVTAVVDRGNWSLDGVDPIDQLDEQLDLLTKEVGSTANINLDMDVTAWRTLRNHAKVKNRVNGAQATPITREQLVGSLVVPVNLMISSIVYDQNKIGQSSTSKKRLLASEVLLYYSVPNPTVYDPSAFKTFTVGPENQISSVRSYKALHELWDGHVIDWSEDIKQTGSAAMKRLTIT